jgi:integrase
LSWCDINVNWFDGHSADTAGHMAQKLTPIVVRDLDAPLSGNRIEYDVDVKGFGVRITAAGTRSFVLNYRTNSGRERRLTIGKHPEWSVTAAREEAKGLLRRIDHGEDPLGKRVKDRNAPTVAELAARYIEEHLPSKRPSSQREDRAMIDSHVLPELKHFKVSEVTFSDISALHRKITKTGHAVRANRALALLSKMFSLAVRWEMRTDNPCKGVERNHEEGRERYLEPEEIARLVKALAEHEDQEAANAIMLALLTGARKGELLKSTWDQFDLAKGVWTKPATNTKTNKLHRIPLNGAAVQLLKTMHDTAPRGQKHLFPGCITAAGRIDIRGPWAQVCLAAGLSKVRFHDLRHSYASILASGGLSLPIIGKLLGHTQAATTQRYAHLFDDPLLKATEGVGRLVKGKP